MMRQCEATAVYDSARTPETAGVRGAAAGKRSIGFLADSIRVEMMIDDDMGDFYYCLGQVLDREGKEPRVGMQVRLGDRGEAVATTNDYGEFTVGGQHTGDGQLLIIRAADDEILCRVPSLG